VTEIVIDNDDLETASNGAWTASTAVAGHEGADYRENPSGPPNPSDPPTYTWTPDIPATATYEIHAKWTADTDRASNAEYVIETEAGSDIVAVDQRAALTVGRAEGSDG